MFEALLKLRDPCSAVSAFLDITGKMVLAFLFLALLGLLYSASRLWPKLIGIVFPPLRGKSLSSEAGAHELIIRFTQSILISTVLEPVYCPSINSASNGPISFHLELLLISPLNM